MYAELWTDDGRECQVRADTVDNFITDVFTHYHRKVQRKRYREERKHPEWIDHGGES